MRTDTAVSQSNRKHQLPERATGSLARERSAALDELLSSHIPGHSVITARMSAREWYALLQSSGQAEYFVSRLEAAYLHQAMRSQCDLAVSGVSAALRVVRLQLQALGITTQEVELGEASASMQTIDANAAHILDLTVTDWAQAWRDAGIALTDLFGRDTRAEADRIAIYKVLPQQSAFRTICVLSASSAEAYLGHESAGHHLRLSRSHCDLVGIEGPSGPVGLIVNDLEQSLTALDGKVAMGLLFSKSDRNAIWQSATQSVCMDIVRAERMEVFFKTFAGLTKHPAMPGIYPKTWLGVVEGAGFDLLREIQGGNRSIVCPGISQGLLLVRKANRLVGFANKLLQSALRSTEPGLSMQLGSTVSRDGEVYLLSNGFRYGITIPCGSEKARHGSAHVSVFRVPLGTIVGSIAQRMDKHAARLGELLVDLDFMAALLDHLGGLLRSPEFQLRALLRHLIFDANAFVLGEMLHRYQVVSGSCGYELVALPFWAIDADPALSAAMQSFGVDARITNDEISTFLSETHMRALGEMSWATAAEHLSFSRSARARLDDFLQIYETKTPSGVGDALHSRFTWRP